MQPLVKARIGQLASNRSPVNGQRIYQKLCQVAKLIFAPAKVPGSCERHLNWLVFGEGNAPRMELEHARNIKELHYALVYLLEQCKEKIAQALIEEIVERLQESVDASANHTEAVRSAVVEPLDVFYQTVQDLLEGQSPAAVSAAQAYARWLASGKILVAPPKHRSLTIEVVRAYRVYCEAVHDLANARLRETARKLFEWEAREDIRSMRLPDSCKQKLQGCNLDTLMTFHTLFTPTDNEAIASIEERIAQTYLNLEDILHGLEVGLEECDWFQKRIAKLNG